MQLRGVMTRYKGLPAGDEAAKIVTEYQSRDARPWETDAEAERCRFLVATASAYSAYAKGETHPQYAENVRNLGQTGVQLWERIMKTMPDSPQAREAPQQIESL